MKEKFRKRRFAVTGTAVIVALASNPSTLAAQEPTAAQAIAFIDSKTRLYEGSNYFRWRGNHCTVVYNEYYRSSGRYVFAIGTLDANALRTESNTVRVQCANPARCILNERNNRREGAVEVAVENGTEVRVARAITHLMRLYGCRPDGGGNLVR
jgi:hypothetical protein